MQRLSAPFRLALVVLVLLSMLAFGALVGIRGDISGIAARAAAWGLAFLCATLTVLYFTRFHSPDDRSSP